MPPGGGTVAVENQQPAPPALTPDPRPEISGLRAIIKSFRNPRTRWTAVAGCVVLVLFPLIMAIGLVAILVLPAPPR